MTQKSSVEELGPQTKQSTRHERTTNPVWEPPELFGFALDKDFQTKTKRAFVMCTVYDYNRFKDSQPVADTILPLRKLKMGEVMNKEKEFELTLHDPESGTLMHAS